MNAPILCVRLSRRAAAAVVLSNERLAFYDGRHLRSNNSSALTGVARYAQLLLDQAHPSTIVLDCPMKDGSSTNRLAEAAKAVFTSAGMVCLEIDSAALCLAYGWTRAVTRLQMRSFVEPMFTELATLHGKVKPYVVDAAAAALFVESGTALGTFAT